jgi:hypothetical protein
MGMRHGHAMDVRIVGVYSVSVHGVGVLGDGIRKRTFLQQ